MKEITQWPGYDEEFWAQLFDGRIWELKRGEDFRPSARDFKGTVQDNADRRGVSVRMTRTGDHTLVIQKISYQED